MTGKTDKKNRIKDKVEISTMGTLRTIVLDIIKSWRMTESAEV